MYPLHVEYVAPGPGDAVEAIELLVRTLSEPLVAALAVGGAIAVAAVLGAYLYATPFERDVAVLRETLSSYRDLVPWMLRLSIGLPLLGAGFAGYLFSPLVDTPPGLRLVQVGLGFLLLVGLATRVAALAGLALYLAALALSPGVAMALEYVPGFVAIALVGGGRPSGDEMLQRVASADGTAYGRVDPIHRGAAWLNRRLEPYRPLVPTVVRVGLGAAFVNFGFADKLLNAGEGLAVVAKYDLTAVVPVSPEAWVVGAALVEIALGLALVVGFFTRACGATAFAVFTLTLFALPDDPVLAHVSLFGLASAVFTMGSGPYALDRALGRRADERRAAADRAAAGR